MTRRVILPALALAAISAVVIATGQVPSTGDTSTGPVVRLARHDRSPRLRDLPRVAPSDGRNPWEREPGPRHRGRGPRGVRVDTIVQDLLMPPAIPSPSDTFDGIGNVNNVLPPDTTGDVGPNHFVQWVNLSFAVYSKGAGTPTLIYGPAAGSTLWAGFGGPCESTNNGDPIVLYDHLADRWVMAQLSLPNSFLGIIPRAPFYQCIAVSATSDPLGAYHRYEFEFDKLNDYPKLGVWPNAYFMTMNQFTSVTLNFAGQGVVAFDRASMLAGAAATSVYFDLAPQGLDLGGMLPADLDGPAPPAASPGYFMQVDDDAWGYSPDQLRLWRFNVDWANPAAATFTGPSVMPVAPFDSDMCGYSRSCIAQRETGARVDAMADRLMYRLQYRNFGDHESLVVNHTVDADGTDHAGVRWYEIRNPRTSPIVYQQGTYAPDADHRWMGSAALDRVGNLALGFTVSGPDTFPSIRYAGRLASDPLGVLAEGETTLIAGSGSQTHSSGRWGDYSTMQVDPVDECTFWYTHEYYASTSAADWRTHVGVFSFPSCTGAPDQPRVTITATTPNAPESGATPGRLTVARTGITAAPVTVSYSVSGTAAAGVDYTPLANSVTIPAGASEAPIEITAIDDVAYEGNETVLVTLGPVAGYRLGIATGIVSIVEDDNPPDLVVTVTAPPGAGAGTTVAINDTTANQGTGPGGESVTNFYLSTNASFDAADVFLAGRQVPSLTAGTTSQASTNVTIPSGTSPGTYYVVARADANDSVPEALNDNNTAASAAVRIGPDLVVAAITIPAAAGPGETFQVSETTSNTGGGDAPATATRFYLSANLSFDATDPEIGVHSVPALAAGATSAAQPSLAVPQGTPPGLYFIHAKADSDNAATEISETNNVKTTLSMKVGPDLTVTGVTAPATASPGATISVGDTTRNQGGGSAPGSTTTYVLSTNAVFDSSDVAIGSRAVPGIAAGGSNAGSGNATIPANATPGTYYVFAVADGNNAVAESVEGNNSAALGATVRLGPDLSVLTVTAPATAAAGATISIGDTTRNAGAGAAPASTTTFYLSSNATFDASDTPLGARAVSALASGGSETGSTSVQLPPGIPAGTMYVIAKADGPEAIAESVETNNASFGVAVKFGADLTVSITAPATASAGATISIGDTTRNNGAGAAAASTTTFYLSTNVTLDASDTPLGARAIAALGAGASDTGSTPVQLPAVIPAGTMYVIAKADGTDAILESVETNNASPAVAVRFGADLTVSITVPATASAGATISLGDTTRNNGASAAPASTTQFYLSPNASLDASDTPLGARSVSALAAGASEGGSTSVQIPPGTPTGNLFVLAKADATDAVGESVETNNVSAAVMIRIGPDLTASGVTAPTWATPGATITVGATTKNQGAGAAGASTTVFYLSTNALLDAADLAIGGRPVPALAANATDTGTASVQIPIATTTGLYYVLAKADGNDAVVETNESNNASFAASVRIGTDLTVSALTAASSAGAGSTIGVTDTTNNVGTLAASASTTRFYLSTNTLLDGADVLIGSRSAGALAPGASETVTTPIALPPGTTGSFYILAVADGVGAVVEVFEDNNIRSRAIQITGQ